ncbi:hypothetical protein KKG31_00375 [Patescibacteria group bacterium]|nr:hypothetical protein [Patescibacteria group bacterium]MBU1757645.1 hypothetical protein [Patescibacteria group bacterium]
MQNQQFCIENKIYPKQEYLQKKDELLRKKDQFTSWYDALCKVQGKNVQTKDCTGTSLFNCVDVENGYVCLNLERGRNAIGVQSEQTNEDMYNVFLCGRSHDFY